MRFQKLPPAKLIERKYVRRIGSMQIGKSTDESPQRVVYEVVKGLSRRGVPLTTVIVPKSGGVTSTKVKVGEPLVELETEKVSFELESPAAGTLLKFLAQETAEVPVGDALCEIADSKSNIERHK